MITFDDFVSPLDPSHFMNEVFGRSPRHFRSDVDTQRRRRSLLDWAQFNSMLEVTSHWDADTLKLVMNGRPVLEEHYCDTVKTLAGETRRASMAKVGVFLGLGASLVANQAHQVSSSIRAASDCLSDAFLGVAEANVYCSFEQTQAFSSHYDLHEVFAVQVEGEKVWNIYSGRAVAPLDPPPFTDYAQAQILAARGVLVEQVRMEPGDVLYIPRGCYHDAIASSEASLHITFSVTPLNGRHLLALLQAAALRDEAFRLDLPDHRLGGGSPFRTSLSGLADKLHELALSPGFALEVAAAQRGRVRKQSRVALPQRQAVRFLRSTGMDGRLVRSPDGATVVSPNGTVHVGLMDDPAEWLLTRPAFSMPELHSRYPQFDPKELAPLVDALVKLRLFENSD